MIANQAVNEEQTKEVENHVRKPKAPTVPLTNGNGNHEETKSINGDNHNKDQSNFVELKEIELVLCDTNKEVIKNSVKVGSFFIIFLTSKSLN